MVFYIEVRLLWLPIGDFSPPNAGGAVKKNFPPRPSDSGGAVNYFPPRLSDLGGEVSHPNTLGGTDFNFPPNHLVVSYQVRGGDVHTGTTKIWGGTTPRFPLKCWVDLSSSWPPKILGVCNQHVGGEGF